MAGNKTTVPENTGNKLGKKATRIWGWAIMISSVVLFLCTVLDATWNYYAVKGISTLSDFWKQPFVGEELLWNFAREIRTPFFLTWFLPGLFMVYFASSKKIPEMLWGAIFALNGLASLILFVVCRYFFAGTFLGSPP